MYIFSKRMIHIAYLKYLWVIKRIFLFLINVKIGFLKYFLKIKNFFILIPKKYLRKAKGLAE